MTADRHHRVPAWKEPAVRVHDALLPSGTPPLAQQWEQARGQHRVAVSPALAALDAQQHALAVDVAHLEGRDLGDAQARAVSDRQCRLVLQTGCGLKQSLHLLEAQHHGDLAGMRGPNELAGKVGPVERMREEKP